MRERLSVCRSSDWILEKGKLMNDQLLSLAADPGLLEIALCIGAIWVLRWIEAMK
jgi:hypothetical protein